MENQENSNLFHSFSEKNLEEILSHNSGILQVNCKLPVRDKSSLALVYSPGVGACCKEIEKDLWKAEKLTNKKNSILIITDTSNIVDANNSNLKNAQLMSLPYLESICSYYKLFADIDAYPVIMDLAALESEMDFVETLDALMPAYSSVELYNVKSSKFRILEVFIKNKIAEKQQYAIIGRHIKRSLEKEIKTIFSAFSQNSENKNSNSKTNQINNYNLDYLNANFLYACVLRSALDLKLYSALDDCIEFLLKMLKNTFANSHKNDDFMQKNFSNFHNAMDFFIKKSCEFFIETEAQLRPLKNSEDKKLIKSAVEQIRRKFYNFSILGKASNIEEYPEKYHQSQKSINENSILLHWRYHGVIETGVKFHIKEPSIFSKIFSWENLDYIADLISKDNRLASKLTYKANFGAIITNGTAILGFGDIGALPGLPVMEGKSVLFKLFGGLNIMPLCIQEKKISKFISIVKKIGPSFSVINLEDIKAPDCFEIETTLITSLDYPVFHDDQHGTAIVVLSGIINSLKLANKKINDVKIVMNGAGAAGLSVCDLLLTYGAKNIIVCDTTGAIYSGRPKNMNSFKAALASKTNLVNETGGLKDVLKGADIFIGVSAPKTLTQEMIRSMAANPIIFALANPEPEIFPEEAYAAGAFIVATGRSDLKNQVNNSLAFPGIFRAAVDVKASKIDTVMKLEAGIAISKLIKESELSRDYIIPDALDSRVPISVAKAVAKKAIEIGMSQDKDITELEVEDNLAGWLLEESLKNWGRIKQKGFSFQQEVLKPKF
jgi:malic enzyme